MEEKKIGHQSLILGKHLARKNIREFTVIYFGFPSLARWWTFMPVEIRYLFAKIASFTHLNHYSLSLSVYALFTLFCYKDLSWFYSLFKLYCILVKPSILILVPLTVSNVILDLGLFYINVIWILNYVQTMSTWLEEKKMLLYVTQDIKLNKSQYII